MIDDAAGFTGSIPHDYDQGLGPTIFVDYADELAKRVGACASARVLEAAAGTGIVTRKLRDLLPQDVRLMTTDLNAPMLEIARTKFQPGEEVEFQPADATALPFRIPNPARYTQTPTAHGSLQSLRSTKAARLSAC